MTPDIDAIVNAMEHLFGPGVARYEIRRKDGTVIASSENKMFYFFCDRVKAKPFQRVEWGDHCRVMSRRKDPPHVILKCKQSGETYVNLMVERYFQLQD